MQLTVNHLFVTPIWKAPTPLPEGAYEWALRYKENNESCKKSNVGGYQSSSKTFDKLPLVYAKHITDICMTLLKVDFVLNDWWLNVNEKGNFNTQHTHPKADLSGIWYITDNNNSLAFVDPLSHSRYALNGVFNNRGDCVSFNSKAGEILIFPSDVPHFVEPHELDTKRISVSFNMSLIH